MRGRTAVLVLIALSGCTSWRPDGLCPAGQQPMEVNELFFGRAIEGRAPVSDEEWSAFADRVIAKEFPDGFTVSDGEGRWRDPATGRMIHEQSKIVLIASRRSGDAAAQIARISDAYRSAFHQTSVGVLGYTACGAF